MYTPSAWTNETLARVTAPELARDVAGAERLVARHDDIHAEIQAKDDEFNALYADGQCLNIASSFTNRLA